MAWCPIMNSGCEKNYCAWYDYDKEQCSIFILAKSTYKSTTLEEDNWKTRFKTLEKMIKDEMIKQEE